ncbi:MAG: hypothetical protein WC004_04655 [Candidatus Absconditabacterales bacterium]
MQNSINKPSDQWFIDKYSNQGEVLPFSKVYFELIELFGNLNKELNKQTVDVQTVENLSAKIASIVNKVKSIIESKQDRSLISRFTMFMDKVKELMKGITADLKKDMQAGQFNTQIDSIIDDTEYFQDLQLTYHSYKQEISGALITQERPQTTLSIEHIGLRKNLTKRQRIKYFEEDGSAAFQIDGDINTKTLGEYFTLSQNRTISGSSPYASVKETQNRERIFHHYVGFIMLLQIAKQQYENKMITMGTKQVPVGQYIDIFIDLGELRSFTNNFVEHVSYCPTIEDGDKSIRAFSEMYVEHAYLIIQAIFS